MAKRGQGGPDFGPLEIRAGGLGRLLALAVVLETPTLLGAFFWDEFDVVVASAGLGFAGVVVIGAIVRQARWRAKGCLVRLDEAGVTLTGVRTVGWDEIREVREVHKSSWEGLVFLPRDGAALPLFSLTLFDVRRDRRTDRLTRQWGSPLVLFPRNLDVSRTQIIDAVRRFSGGVPILDEERELVVS